jgi:hypothetical protein
MKMPDKKTGERRKVARLETTNDNLTSRGGLAARIRPESLNSGDNESACSLRAPISTTESIRS